MSIQSIGRLGGQCLTCCSHKTIRTASIRASSTPSATLTRPFYSASSLQLPRQRVNPRKKSAQDLAALDTAAAEETIEDALSGQAERARVPRDKQTIKPAARWDEEPQWSRPIAAAPKEETIVEEEPESEPEPREWISRQSQSIEVPGDKTEEGMPWYLQVQQDNQPSPDINPLLERQRLPDLPSTPPPLLQPLLNHISTTLGLDSLSLIDLRHLDPPAALGANLLMIVGTARSEKHLHVSADRLCRWLRSEHKLRPYADGLLGRNELKLKMKRKNRRSKTLAAAGLQGWNGPNGIEKEVDDGIRTGWVCVHLGRVEPGVATEQELTESSSSIEPSNTAPETTISQQQAPAFIGFGETEDHITIVVQMFTEQKRDETDLEGLWTDISERGFRKQKHRKALDEGLPSPEESSSGPAKKTAAYIPYLPRRVERTYAS